MSPSCSGTAPLCIKVPVLGGIKAHIYMEQNQLKPTPKGFCSSNFGHDHAPRAGIEPKQRSLVLHLGLGLDPPSPAHLQASY